MNEGEKRGAEGREGAKHRGESAMHPVAFG